MNNGAKADLQTGNGNSALVLASLKGNEETVQLLLEHGAQVNLKTNTGATALFAAAITRSLQGGKPLA
ncbi:MAG: ankyrin repeat domain-containing protein [Marinilabiliales bacterium]|nr:ankyrin repeat domain-containing protein [Marinilabiliales bacterium]